MSKILVILIFLSLTVAAQKTVGPKRISHDIGIMIGGSYYLGELNPSKHFSMSQPAFGVLYRLNPNHRLALRAAFNYGAIMGDDSQSDDDDQIARNLNFKSTLSELSAVVEFNFIDYRINVSKHFFSPYVFLGFAVLRHNPKASIQSKYVELQPLTTEGQGTSLDPNTKKYKLTQFTIPFGIGAKLNLAKNVGLSFEWGMRKTFTDYLDDVSKTYIDPSLLAQQKGVLAGYLSNLSLSHSPYSMIGSQRGNPYIKDWYCFFGFQISFQIHGRPKSCAGASGKK